jgi:hypothetical protein
MNALVDPSFTESINPRMSLLTISHRGKDRLIKEIENRKKNASAVHINEDLRECAHLLRTFEPQRVRSPALLLGHNVRHSLTATANARDADGRSFEFGDVMVFGLNSGDDRPSHDGGGELCALALVDMRKRDQFNGVLT